MTIEIPPTTLREALAHLVLTLADDELILGHRDSEWTGYGPILEEDIAFSNIAQDEIGHSLVWFTLYEQLTGRSPDWMGFERRWEEFRCCRFVAYPKGDFAYTVVRQYFFDVAEQVRLQAFLKSSFRPLNEIAEKLLREESYHILHSKGLVERLGRGTEESHRRMQSAVDLAFPQALGMFERIEQEDSLVQAGVFPGNPVLQAEWLMQVLPTLKNATLNVPVKTENGKHIIQCSADVGGRTGRHTDDLKQLVHDMQAVYQLAPDSKW